MEWCGLVNSVLLVMGLLQVRAQQGPILTCFCFTEQETIKFTYHNKYWLVQGTDFSIFEIKASFSKNCLHSFQFIPIYLAPL